ARREGVTRFMAVTAVAAALLHRLSGQDRLVTGTLNANRNRPELAPLLGFFLTQLPLPIDLSGDPTFRELLGRVRQVALGAFAHQDLPFGKLVEAVQPERDLSRMPLVQTLVQLIDAQGAAPVPGGLDLEPVDVYDGNTRYDLMLALYELSDGIEGPLEYNAEIFDASTAQRWLNLFFRLAEAAVADPEIRLSALPAFGEAERHQVLVEWNATTAISAPPVVPQFQAERAPDAVVWTGEGWRLTYAELEDRSNRLARHLRRLGAGPGTLVGLFLERDALLPVGLLGILKSGAAYLPLDLAYPPERRALVLEDAGAPLIVTCERLLDGLPDTAAHKICLEEVATESAEPLPLTAGPDDRAYVIYTSGSTGRPKGVEIPHGALAALLAALRQLYRVGPGDVMPGITTPAFDLSVPELYLPMLGGGTTPLLDRETAADGTLLARALDAHGATVLQASPATYRQLLGSGWQGRPEMLLLCGAEALDRELADRLLPLGRGLWNFYGPTEATVWATAWRVEPGEPISIGRPIAGYEVHLLDPRFVPVPLGAVGEICIGGPGLARGYLGRPDLTAERFVPHPGGRLYRTGDLGRFLPDGLLRYEGRADHQVKLRGFRIELGEIEAALRRHPAVSEAVVLRREDRPGDARLVAYLAGSEAPAGEELRSLLRSVLPEHMVPSAFVALPALPRNPNGKVDRKALAEIRPETPAGGRVAPRTPVEELLAAIWSRVLEVEEVGVDDDFFALGGHSLLATQVVTRIREAFGVELPVRAVFQAPTLEAQADLVTAARAGASPRAEPIRPVPRGGDLPLSFAQERLWFLQQLDPASPAYNIPFALRVTGSLDVPALERAFAEVVRRHEILRTTFHDQDGAPAQRIAPPAAWTIPVTEGDPERLAREDALTPFDLAQGPLLRTRLVRLAPGEHVLLLCIHHAIADLWGLGILVQEVAALYEGQGPLPELPVQYADFAVWQRSWLRGAELERQVDFWRAELADAPPALDLPTDRPRPSAATSRGESRAVELSEEVARLGRERGATPFMVLLAALGAVCARWSGQEDVVLGAPVANRQRPELEGLVGMFVNSLPLRVRTGGEPSFSDLLARVRRSALDAYEHQDVPFEKLVEELRPPRDLGRHPLFQAVLAFQNVRQGRIDLPDLTLEPLDIGSAVARFELTLTLFESEEGLAGSVEWAADLFDAATIERLLGSLKTFLAAAASSPETAVADLPLLSEGERRQVLVDWNDTASPFPNLPIHELFAEQAALRPDAVAVELGDERLTYGELQERASRVARRLRLQPEQPVAVLAERSLDLIVNLLAILQAGGAYMPLDPSHPQERRDWMMKDAGAIPLSLAETETDLSAVLPESLAYVMYTSGSTGTPKGVAVTHRNVVRLVRGADYAEMEHTWLQYAPVAFDASTLEIWAPLLNGCRLVLFPGRIGSLDDLAGVIERHGVTSTWLTAGLFHEMLDGLRPLRQLLAGGDVLSPDHVRRVLEAHPDLALINGYGPTEGTTFTCCHRITEVGETVPIGRPIANTRVYVLDDRLEPAPAWGELYTGGEGLARGYLNRPDLTAERFVPDPFGEGRLYRTGDRVRWRTDGTLEFQGR
ncbi:MAG TPA: amino acid adenylation domain-containing protein, partial [Thermoanaerobaculia bacterium]|nr:amino acid adenylation domain-containing protein [Thermoanaerobaculia bacterium]